VVFFGDRLPRVDELVVDYRVLLIAAAATLATVVACGLWPSLRSSTQSGVESLRVGGVTTARSHGRVRRGLVTVQFALALVLLVGAGLLVQSFKRVAEVNVGFDPQGLLTARIGPSGSPSAEESLALYRRLMEATRSVPGVSESAFVSFPPYGSAMFTTLSIEGRSSLDSSNQVFYRTVSDSFFRTMRMSLAAGRWFDESDMRAPAGKFVINETMARQYWPGQNAIGQRITVRRASQARADFGQPLPGEVIGVIANVHQGRLDQVPDAEVYVPFTLETWPWGFIVMRTRDGERSIPALTRAIASVDPRLVRPRDRGAGVVSAVESSIADSLRPRKLSMSLISAFAACALLLAAIAMYGIVAYGVAQRTREIGVRKALGATDRDIMRLLFRESTWVVVAGIVVGSAAAVASARLIRGLLFQTDITDPMAFGATIVVLTAAAGLATYVPARRAIRLDPSLAMRIE
jgi:predicted permease